MFARLGRRRGIEYIDGENLSNSHQQSQQKCKSEPIRGQAVGALEWIVEGGGFHAPFSRIGVLSSVVGLADYFRLRFIGCPVGETRRD